MVNKTEDTPLAADPATERSERVVEEAERHHYRPRALTLCCLLRALMLFADMVNQLTGCAEPDAYRRWCCLLMKLMADSVLPCSVHRSLIRALFPWTAPACRTGRSDG